MPKISVVINTLNEEKNISASIKSAKNLADEIVVVDMHSDDKTAEIAEKLGAKVYQHERTGYVEPARNYAISKTSGDWIFILDADERIPEKLTLLLLKEVKSPRADYFSLPRKNIVFGKWLKHSRWWPDYNIRFFRKNHVTWNEVIHSVPMTSGKGADIEAKEIYAIVHNHYESVEQFITRLNRYTTEQSKDLVKGGYNFVWSDLIKKPSSEFLSRYFFGEGYKDGLHGLALAGLQAFSEFAVYLKVWQKEGFDTKDVKLTEVIAEMDKNARDVKYWQADAMLKKTGNFKYRIKRKLKI